MNEVLRGGTEIPKSIPDNKIPLDTVLEARKFIPSNLSFGKSLDTPQFCSITNTTEVSTYAEIPACLVVGQGEMIFVPTSCTQEVATYGLSRCTAIAGFHETGRVLAHYTENDLNAIIHVLDRLQKKFSGIQLILVVPLAEPRSELFAELHPDSQLLSQENVNRLQKNLPHTTVRTYPCTDVTSQQLDTFAAHGGIPETAVVMNEHNISIIPTLADGEGNILISK
jgi:hypothetical protein